MPLVGTTYFRRIIGIDHVEGELRLLPLVGRRHLLVRNAGVEKLLATELQSVLNFG
jgi:hypothetical protein